MMQAPPTSAPHRVVPSAESAGAGTAANVRSFDNLRVTSFSFAAAWHLLALFAVVPQSSTIGVQGEPLSLRLSLYASSALMFLLLGILLKARPTRHTAESALTRAAFAPSAFACLASALALMSASMGPSLQAACFCVLGVADALFVTSALTFLSTKSTFTEHSRNMTMNAVLGALMAFFVMFIVEPLSWILLCLLPLGTYAISRIEQRGGEKQRAVEAAEIAETAGAASRAADAAGTASRAADAAGAASRAAQTEEAAEDAKRTEGKLHGVAFHALVSGLAFGLCQGALGFNAFASEGLSFAVSCSWIPVAGLLAAWTLYLISEDQLRRQGSSAVVRLGTSFMLAGVFLAVFSLADASSLRPESVEALDIASEALALAGCCTFGLGLPAMLLLSNATRGRVACFFGISHFFCFGGLALGVLGGYLLTANDPAGVESAALSVVGAAGLLACLASMPLFDRLLPHLDVQEPKVVEQAAEAEAEVEPKVEPAAATAAAATTTQASAKEDESASESTNKHTGEHGDVALFTGLVSTGTPPCSPSSSTSFPTEPSAISDIASPTEPSATADDTSDANPSPAEPPRNVVSPTEAIARDFNLSRREHQVLCYLSHGRNAAFIQQELDISIYTVKTHIANIYGKIGAHSIQDVIDLVEAYGDSPEAPNARKAAVAADASASRKEKTSPKGSLKQEKARHDVA
ncbi:MAG: helix-turn-helix transcriptional regulator [Eggerthellaceae bacterium]|nr:helix-turn-helix transcriptional regulator [Eggerthellaceae bacterium]